MASTPPQPAVHRIVPFAGHPLVVGVVPNGSDLVVHTALEWANALEVEIYFAYVDTSRIVITEHPDGTVDHISVDPDILDDAWRDWELALHDWLTRLCADQPVAWHVRYLAGRPDRALTHLARTVDASAFVIGAHGVRSRWRADEFLNQSIGIRLSHHQHRPVLTVPLAVVDWKAKTPWQ
ncbi:MAG: universal stress protein [Propionibacterium sp.]|nr:universal stress protein [Propionibacterium sp.]